MGEHVDASDMEGVMQLMRQLPVHEDVQTGLSNLRDQGYRLATLTNESVTAVSERMERTGLISYFDALLSASSVKRNKPATETYHWAAKHLGVPASDILMVSMHGWDVAGALYAGMPAALIGRYNQSPYPLAPGPTYMAPNLIALAEELHKAQVI
ncbi:MAG: HAD family hydrolase [Sphingobacteriales bacterium]|nr:MAG: HAD family hydrolase [Sphingobacteriales bacterium]